MITIEYITISAKDKICLFRYSVFYKLPMRTSHTSPRDYQCFFVILINNQWFLAGVLIKASLYYNSIVSFIAYFPMIATETNITISASFEV